MSDHLSGTFPARGMACLVGVLVASCSQPLATPTRPPVPIAPPPRDVILDPQSHPELSGVWNDFWSRSWPLDQVPQSQWRPVLADVADGPLTAHLVQRKAQDLAQSVRLYGQVWPHLTTVQPRGDWATVTDCQDNSRAGRGDIAGQPKTVGVARNRVLGTLIRTPGGWRVSRVDYPGGGC